MRINPYSTLSKIYDISRENENTFKWSEFIGEILGNCKINLGSNILDCGCGTGDISIFLAKSGYGVDAIDTSADMLMLAKEKSHSLGLKINYTIQDMRTFKTHNKYSMITCINDGINYLINLGDVELFFDNCSKHLESGAFLLFDISTIYKLKNMDSQFFTEETDEIAYIWSNEFDDKKKTLTMDLTFFTQIDDDVYQRTSEMHVQRAHSVEEIDVLLNKCGFSLINLYGDVSLEKPTSTSERIHFLAQKL